MASNARVVLHGEWWRVVALELEDAHGVLNTEYVIEQTEPKSKDRLGVQQWKELKDNSALGDWIRATRAILDELLKAAGEKPNNEPKQPQRERSSKPVHSVV
jgi:hypothetical protein